MTVISIPDKSTQPIPGGGVNGPWYTQSFLGDTDFALDWNGRMTVHLQYRLLMPDDETKWPTWLEIQTVRHGGDTETGAETSAIPPKKSQAGLYLVEMDSDPAIPISLQIRHNGKAPIIRVKAILKIAPKITEVVAR